MVEACNDGQNGDVAIALRRPEGQGADVLLQFNVHYATITGGAGKCLKRDVLGRQELQGSGSVTSAPTVQQDGLLYYLRRHLPRKSPRSNLKQGETEGAKVIVFIL